MKANYDRENDILYVIVREGPAYDSEELDDDVRIEYDKNGKIIGVEILDASRNIGRVMAAEESA